MQFDAIFAQIPDMLHSTYVHANRNLEATAQSLPETLQLCDLIKLRVCINASVKSQHRVHKIPLRSYQIHFLHWDLINAHVRWCESMAYKLKLKRVANWKNTANSL